MKIKLEDWEAKWAIAYGENLRAQDKLRAENFRRNSAIDDVLFPRRRQNGMEMPKCLNEYRQRQTLTDWMGR